MSGIKPNFLTDNQIANLFSVSLRIVHSPFVPGSQLLLLAEEDEESVCQDRNGRSMNARWTVEIVNPAANAIRLKSSFGKYLTASNMPFLLGMSGKKVLQNLPRRLDCSTEWEPIREGIQIRLMTRYGQYLRANGGLPPWRNSITHDIPQRTATQDWILWDVEILESKKEIQAPVRQPVQPPVRPPAPESFIKKEDESDLIFATGFTLKSPRLPSTEMDDGSVCSPGRVNGRMIYYRVADKDGNVEEGDEEQSLRFKGKTVEELRQKLEEETKTSNVSVCSRNPLNGKLYPLRLHLPPNSTTMHVFLVPSPSL